MHLLVVAAIEAEAAHVPEGLEVLIHRTDPAPRDELGVPVHLVKRVSDRADETAHDWSAAVDGCARDLGRWVAGRARG